MLTRFAHYILSYPRVFDLQQQFSQDYNDVKTVFDTTLKLKNKKILDVGCSTGTAAKIIFDMKENEYHGIDIIAEYVHRAQSKNPQGKFHLMDARKLNFPKEYFDIVFFNGMLHHIDDGLARDCFHSVQKVLGKNGRVLVAEPIFCDRFWSTFFLNRDRGDYIRTQQAYENLFSGLKIIEKSIFRFSLHDFTAYTLEKI